MTKCLPAQHLKADFSSLTPSNKKKRKNFKNLFFLLGFFFVCGNKNLTSSLMSWMDTPYILRSKHYKYQFPKESTKM